VGQTPSAPCSHCLAPAAGLLASEVACPARPERSSGPDTRLAFHSNCAVGSEVMFTCILLAMDCVPWPRTEPHEPESVEKMRSMQWVGVGWHASATLRSCLLAERRRHPGAQSPRSHHRWARCAARSACGRWATRRAAPRLRRRCAPRRSASARAQRAGRRASARASRPASTRWRSATARCWPCSRQHVRAWQACRRSRRAAPSQPSKAAQDTRPTHASRVTVCTCCAHDRRYANPTLPHPTL